MATTVILLRGINLGASNRIAMPALRDALAQDGFSGVRTHVQSGNILVRTELPAGEIADRVQRLIGERFGLSIPAVARSRDELARIVAANPFPALAAAEPRRLQVSFLRGEPAAGTAQRLEALATPTERVAVLGQEIYAWHPDGIARSKLWARLGARGGLGPEVTATSRNWATVTALLELADAGLH